LALTLAGCGASQKPATTEAKAATEAADVVDDARDVADATLGKQAEILAHGDLAQNGRDQVLVINRLPGGAAATAPGSTPSPILVRRAAILEKSDGKWSEILLCDEHLKNPDGFLGGTPVARVDGWRLEYTQDAQQGLKMKFTPAEKFSPADGNADPSSEQMRSTFDVRWNKSAKRYQSFDQSHERYLSEVPSLEIPQSILK
jgi:hypothetical protein